MSNVKNVNKNVNAPFVDSAILNSATYVNYLERLKLVACSMFEWINLPSSMLNFLNVVYMNMEKLHF